MMIYPAMDLIDGRCVRLMHGDFDQVTRYGDPLDQIKAFADAGAAWVHVVDLDGARAGVPVQTALIARLAQAANPQIQCGGGVRDERHVEIVLGAGVARVVIGSTAARSPDAVRAWLTRLGADKVCCAFDVRQIDGEYAVATSGWRETAAIVLDAALDAYADSGLRHVLVTDIGRDGALGGPNVALISALTAKFPDLLVQASGGVATLADLPALRAAGAAGVIIGRALYERRFTLEAALAC